MFITKLMTVLCNTDRGIDNNTELAVNFRNLSYVYSLMIMVFK